jgi:hypothetical protein
MRMAELSAHSTRRARRKSLASQWDNAAPPFVLDRQFRVSTIEQVCNVGEPLMLTIRLQKADWAKAWRAMIEVAPVRLIGDDPIYEVLPAHLELLTARGFTYEVVPSRSQRSEKRRHGTAN